MIRTVYHRKADDYLLEDISIVEQAPTSRSIAVRTLDLKWTRHYLKWPYLLFLHRTLLGIDRTPYAYYFYAFASPKPIRRPTDVVSVMPLPNTYETGRLCLGIKSPNITHCVEAFFQVTFTEGEVNNYWQHAAAQEWRNGGDVTNLYGWYRGQPLTEMVRYPIPDKIWPAAFDDKDQEISERAKYLREIAGEPPAPFWAEWENNPPDPFWTQAEFEILYDKRTQYDSHDL